MKANSKNRWLLGGTFALGATAGSALALLLAPTSGKVLRKQIGTGFKSVGRSTAKRIQQTRKVLIRKADHIREAALEKLGDTREWLMEKVSNGNGRHHVAPARRLARHS